MSISFVKMVGSGNDFVLIDRRRKGKISRAEGAKLAPLETRFLTGLARKLCDRRFSIGADGVLILEPSRKADFRMKIFNPDGSEAEMCGNGSRCAAYYVTGGRGRVTFETLAGLLEAQVRGTLVKVKLPKPHSFRRNLKATVCGKRLTLHSIIASVPHAILFVENPNRIDVECWGEEIRHHKLFRPRGANVDFVKVRGKRVIEIRTYERGVEGETLSCGTGSTASALVSAKLHGLRSPITVLTKSGEQLRIYFKETRDGFEDVRLEGRVRQVFEGRINDV